MAPPDKPTLAKRKRTHLEADDQDTDIKPASTSRKPSSARSSVGATSARNRTSTRSRPSLQEVPETDEGELDPEDSPPPTKKKRASAVVEVAKDDESSSDEIQEIEPPKRRGVPARRKAAPPRTTRKGKELAKKEDSGEELPTSSTRQRPAALTRKATRGAIKPGGHVSIIISSDSSDSAPKSPVQTTSAGKRKQDVKKEPEPKEENFPTNNRKTAVSRDPGRKTATQSRSKVESNKEDSERPPSPLSVQPPEPVVDSEIAPKSSPEADKNDPVVEEDVSTKPAGDSEMEEEYSLLDIPPPPRSQPPQVQPEEPQGPQSRLVIHKMALINFKSYAGRQEIGPFHKVNSIMPLALNN